MCKPTEGVTVAHPCLGSLTRWLFTTGKRVTMGHVPMGAQHGQVYITATFGSHTHEVVGKTAHEALLALRELVKP